MCAQIKHSADTAIYICICNKYTYSNPTHRSKIFWKHIFFFSHGHFKTKYTLLYEYWPRQIPLIIETVRKKHADTANVSFTAGWFWVHEISARFKWTECALMCAVRPFIGWPRGAHYVRYPPKWRTDFRRYPRRRTAHFYRVWRIPWKP